MRAFRFALMLSCGCHFARAEKVPRFELHQEHGTDTGAPTFQTDVVVPSGRESWRVAVSCKAEGRPCRRAFVSVSLWFPVPRPGVAIALRPAGAPTASSWTSACNEAEPASACTLTVGSGWSTRDAETHELLLDVRHQGEPRTAHVTLSVIDPLE